MPSDQQFQEVEDFLEATADMEPLSPQEVCDWYGIRLQDFPRLAQAGLERELEAISAMARVYRGRHDEKSVALVRQIDKRLTEVRRSIRYWSDLAMREALT